MTATPRTTLAIVGAGLAGARAAEGAREAGFDGRIVLIGDEPTLPYERPPLSKAVLRGEDAPETARVHPDGFYRDHDIELVTDRALGVDVVRRAVELAGGDRVPFDTAVLATGASPRRLAVPGADLDGVHVLRTIDDAARLAEAIRGAARVAVIGAGWIGSEVAASARQMGAEVVLVDPSEVPLRRALGHDVGSVFRELHADHGVDLRLGTRVAELRGTTTVEAVALHDGRVEAADVVVAGIGVTPSLAVTDGQPGLRVGDGILVDEYLESNVAGVYAAGDVASAWHPRYQRRVRVEHWANARHQGVTAGRNAAGKREPYTRLPYFFSDQYDLGLEHVGLRGADDTVTIRGDAAARRFIAFWQRDGVVTAATTVNVWDVVEDLKALIEAGTPIDPRRLADDEVPLPAPGRVTGGAARSS